MEAYSNFQDNIIAFIIGHEYAHALLQHDRQGITVSSGIGLNLDQPSLETFIRKQEQELEADALGAEIAMLPYKEQQEPDLRMVYIAVNLFFAMLDILELFTPTPAGTAHPRAGERQYVFNRLNNKHYDYYVRSEIVNINEFFRRLRAPTQAAINKFVPESMRSGVSR